MEHGFSFPCLVRVSSVAQFFFPPLSCNSSGTIYSWSSWFFSPQTVAGTAPATSPGTAGRGAWPVAAPPTKFASMSAAADRPNTRAHHRRAASASVAAIRLPASWTSAGGAWRRKSHARPQRHSAERSIRPFSHFPFPHPIFLSLIFLSMELNRIPATTAKSPRSTPWLRRILRRIRGLVRSRSGCRAPLACPQSASMFQPRDRRWQFASLPLHPWNERLSPTPAASVDAAKRKGRRVLSTQ